MTIEGVSYGTMLYTIHVKSTQGQISEDVAGLDGMINPELIESLENLVYDMLEHNKRVHDEKHKE